MTSEPTGQGKTVLVDEKPAIIFHLNSAFSPVACFNICFFLISFIFKVINTLNVFLKTNSSMCVSLWGFHSKYLHFMTFTGTFIYIRNNMNTSFLQVHAYTKINFRSSIRSKFSKFLFKSLFRTHINKFKLFIEFEFIS